MVYKRSVAIKRMLATTKNKKGTCQEVTRGWFGVPSVGDYDHDGDADANDGWESEPESAKHIGDRNPPAGVPLYFKDKGRVGFGHRCGSLGDGNLGCGNMARSTDMLPTKYAPGITSTTTIEEIEEHMGLEYVGWSETMDGVLIPDDITKKKQKTSRGKNVDDAIAALKTAQSKRKVGTPGHKAITAALKEAKKVSFIK